MSKKLLKIEDLELSFKMYEGTLNVLKKIKEETVSVAKVELEPKLEGRQAVMILAPEDKSNK